MRKKTPVSPSIPNETRKTSTFNNIDIQRKAKNFLPNVNATSDPPNAIVNKTI